MTLTNANNLPIVFTEFDYMDGILCVMSFAIVNGQYKLVAIDPA